ncbi:MAG: biotin--[acetyl-CoA-carboxylase] ligase [Fimbriimonadaceae bacterium]|nr:Bifunctional ligase/repressor BirA [Fimbriimonadaceae bacterium]MCL4284917.1 biotin--[acetyl-CoA-carboxylase] ligase [Fimbriimonadaceae bacterium]MCZ7580996.1 biotin--[acetyl-CoA-carboxylase] ligase [Fimbriimonadaceae bacterium]QOJ12365.1 MAG: biotin--[acetyl-CoA-carboxylase] ligase [Chthonomonadaceae bacterium]
MKSPLLEGPWVELESVDSTQSYVARCLRGESGLPVPGMVLAREQTAGRGRFDRAWWSPPGSSLSMSLVFGGYPDAPRPWLLGMAVAVAAARVVHCRLKWPNDLIVNGRKIGGILTEMMRDAQGRAIPVVGVGINLTQTEFPPDLASTATSLLMEYGVAQRAGDLARRIVDALSDLPEPDDWPSLAPVWNQFDETKGRRYRLSSGESGIAIGIGPQGELLCEVEGVPRIVYAADDATTNVAV